MLAEVHKSVAEGWALFEEACQEAGPGDLPQLLRSLRGMTTPTLPPMPDTASTAQGTPTPSPIPKKEPQESPYKGKDPVVMWMEGKHKWACPNVTLLWA